MIMKIKVLLTLGLCFALYQTASAQKDSTKRIKPLFEVQPVAVMKLINSNWSPGFGFSMGFHWVQADGRSRYKMSVEHMTSTIGSLDKAHFKDLTTISSYDLKLMSNSAPVGTKPMWLGITVGYLRSSAGGDLDKRIKTGILVQKQSVELAVDFFESRNKEQNISLSVKYYF